MDVIIDVCTEVFVVAVYVGSATVLSAFGIKAFDYLKNKYMRRSNGWG